MSEPVAYVSVNLDDRVQTVGRLWVQANRGREHASFEHDASWLESGQRFAIEPALSLTPGPFHTRDGLALFGALGDSAPDRWGRNLIARAERMKARAENRAPRALREIEYLLAVTDETRQGALRFSMHPDGPFVAAENPGAPPLVQLPKLLRAVDHVLNDSESAADIQLLLAPGSSLGGARPKASVRDTKGTLLIAKFHAVSDPHDVVAWEGVALHLARKAGISVPDSRVVRTSGRSVLLSTRFDRSGRTRIPFLSAMSALNARDMEPRSYAEIADVMRTFSAAARDDLADLWRRLVFNVLISNTDDHLRNHGFLYAGPAGWRLSPAYDLNPVPTHLKPRILSTPIGADGDPSASLEIALATSRHFGLKPGRAREITAEVYASVRRWKGVAVSMKLNRKAIESIDTAFEHEDAQLAAAM